MTISILLGMITFVDIANFVIYCLRDYKNNCINSTYWMQIIILPTTIVYNFLPSFCIMLSHISNYGHKDVRENSNID